MQAVIHCRGLGIRLGTDVTIWFSIWLFISVQLCLTGLTAQIS